MFKFLSSPEGLSFFLPEKKETKKPGFFIVVLLGWVLWWQCGVAVPVSAMADTINPFHRI